MTETTAIHITNGMRVWLDHAWRTVGAAHYAGPIDGSGTTTLELLNTHAWCGPANTPMIVQAAS